MTRIPVDQRFTMLMVVAGILAQENNRNPSKAKPSSEAVDQALEIEQQIASALGIELEDNPDIS